MTSTVLNPSVREGSLTERILTQSVGWKLHWLFRLGVVMEFVGHGACGVHTKAGWLPFFKVFAIPEPLAYSLMPWVGWMDITLGLTTLLAPKRAVLLYMAVWGCFTALLRPAAGQGGWEFIERAYNYGVPLIFLLLHGIPNDRRGWFETLKPTATLPLSVEQGRTLNWVLRSIVALMLIGHGGFGAMLPKKNLLDFYQAAGFGSLGLPLESIRAGIGFFEIGLALAALFVKRPSFFIGVCLWKLASESLYLVAGADLACWEIIERGGSYVAPLAIVCFLSTLKTGQQTSLGEKHSAVSS